MIPAIISKESNRGPTQEELTLNIGNTLLKDLLQNLGVLELLLNLADDGLGKFALLALLDLALVAHPGLQNLLGLGGQSSALLELVGLSLKLSGFLRTVRSQIPQ